MIPRIWYTKHVMKPQAQTATPPPKEGQSPFFSVIVPVYNVAPYLGECLDSVLAQTFTDWECLCIDDGSKDGSDLILDAYARRDPRFRVTHQPNAGVSAARNRGMTMARGEYLAFCDGDDLIDELYLSAFQSLVSKQKLDIVWGRIRRETAVVGADLPFEGYEDLGRVISRRNLMTNTFCWGKIFRRCFVDQAGVKFDVSLSFSEDMVFIYQLLQNVRRVGFSTESFYTYRTVATSCSRVVQHPIRYLRVAHKIQSVLPKIFVAFSIDKTYQAFIWRNSYYGHLFLAVGAMYKRKTERSRRLRILRFVFADRVMLARLVRPRHLLKVIWWKGCLCCPVGVLDKLFEVLSRTRFGEKLLPSAM